MQKPQFLLSPHWSSLRGHHNLNSCVSHGIPTSLQQEHLKISSSSGGAEVLQEQILPGSAPSIHCWGTPQSLLSSAPQSHPDHCSLSLNPAWHSLIKNIGGKGFPAMLWSYPWRALSPEKQGSRGGSDRGRWAEMGSGTSGEASWWNIRLWGRWKHTKQTRFPIRELWSWTQQCGVGACSWCSKAPPGCLAEPVADWMPWKEATEVCQVLGLLLNFSFVFNPWWFTMIWWAPVSSCHPKPAQALQGDPQVQAAPGQARLCCWSC